MTSTLLQVKPSTSMKEWSDVFPDFTTLTGSCLFIKKLIAVSLSSLTYLRGVFPEKAYGERQLCGIKLKLLTEDCGIDGVSKFINLIRSCYDAVDKKYLHQLCIGIGTDIEDKDNVLETFSLTFRYRDDEYLVENESSSVKLTEQDPTVEATLMLLKSIVSISDILGPLPKHAFITMKVLYNDDITPLDYEPQGFEPCENEKYSLPSTAVKIELGKVSTNIHGYKMYLKTALSKEPLSQILEESILRDSQKSRDDERPIADDLHGIPSINDKEQEDIVYDSNNDLYNRTSFKYNNDMEDIDCPCTCKQNTGMDILICDFCGKKQHSVCYGILDPENRTSDFYCIQCINDVAHRNSQEDMIYSYQDTEQQELCALRRALVFCSSIKQVTPFQLERNLKCKKKLAEDLIERLEFDRFIRKCGNKKYIVNDKMIIDSGYKEYFLRSENKENAENTLKRFQKAKLSAASKDKTNAVKRPAFSNNEYQLSDSLMDFSLNEGVEKLNLKNSSMNQSVKSRRRKVPLAVRSKNMADDDDSNAIPSPPRKKRCLKTKEEIQRK